MIDGDNSNNNKRSEERPSFFGLLLDTIITRQEKVQEYKRPSINDDGKNIMRHLIDLVYDSYVDVRSLDKRMRRMWWCVILACLYLGYMVYVTQDRIGQLEKQLSNVDQLVSEQRSMYSSILSYKSLDSRSVWISRSNGYLTEGDATYIRDVVLSRTWADINAIRAQYKKAPLSYDEVVYTWVDIVTRISKWRANNKPGEYGIMKVKYDTTLKEYGIMSPSDLSDNKLNIKAGCAVWVRYISGSSGDIVQGTNDYITNVIKR